MGKANNSVRILGRLTEDPKVFKNAFITFRIAVDFAGNDQTNPENKAGFFSMKMFVNENNPNSKFVLNQVNDGKMKKGSSVAIDGRLVQDTYTNQEGVKQTAVAIVVDDMTYAGGSSNHTPEAKATTANADVPSEF